MPLKRARLSSDWMPKIPADRKSSLISLENRHETISNSVDPDAPAEKFIEKQEELLAIVDEHARMCSTGIEHGRSKGDITQEQYKAAMARINMQRWDTGLEQNTVKRSKRTLSHDIEEVRPCYSSVEEAYQKMVLSKVISCSNTLLSRQNQNDRKALSKNVYEAYQCKRLIGTGDDAQEEFWCPVTRMWWPGPLTQGRSPPIKVAHIVPRSFVHEEGQSMRVFDEDTASLSVNARNALPMHKLVEDAFDKFDIVIVPLESTRQATKPIEFRCVLANKSIANLRFTESLRWRDLDGRQLEFLNDFRPACRYLYFKYCITYMYWKQKGDTEWVTSLEGLRGYIWATPGAYLRRSMLISLAKGSEDLFLPEAFYLQNTFEDGETSSGKVADVDHQTFQNDLRGEILRADKWRGLIKRDDMGTGEEDVDEDESESD